MPTSPQIQTLLDRLRRAVPWSPLPGPQSAAYLSPADELWYGGAAGGGKTQLLLGLALTAHRDSLILRRRAVDTRSISKLLDRPELGRWKWVGAGGELVTHDGRTIQVGGCEHPSDASKYQGTPHDLIGFDELPQFSESMYTFISAWNRPLRPDLYPNLRCRVVGAGNPPTTPEGEWVLRRWRPWLESVGGHITPPGVLRWFVQTPDGEVEVESAQPVTIRGVTYRPRSRTFIRASLEDNPALAGSGYAATLEGLPEPLRSMLRYGQMRAESADHPWQLIPTRWIALAQQRYLALRHRVALPAPTVIGIDVARGGEDQTVLAASADDPPVVTQIIARPGSATPDANAVLALLALVQFPDASEENADRGQATEMAANSPDPSGQFPVHSVAMPRQFPALHVDAIGIGSAVCDIATAAGYVTYPILASTKCYYRDPRRPTLRMTNTRAGLFWNLRERLDPEQPHPLALPPDPELAADLAAIRYSLSPLGVRVESKDDIRRRIGRSPDRADAVALACWRPPTSSSAFA